MKSYQTKHSFDSVLGCFFATQKLSNQTSLDAFLARQQRIKARHSAAQSADNTIAATATLNANTSKKDKGHDAQTSQPFKH